MVEPDHEADKKRQPGHMKNFHSSGKGQQIKICTRHGEFSKKIV
jgi:hypothetical protein